MLASSRHISKNFVASAYRVSRYFSNVQTSVPVEPKKRPTEFQDEFVKRLVDEELITIPNFINEDEERSLLDELDPILTRARYQNAHWDDVSFPFFLKWFLLFVICAGSLYALPSLWCF